MSDIAPQFSFTPSLPETTSPPQVTASVQPVAIGERRLRLWPGLAILVLMWLAITVPGWLAPGTPTQFFGMFWGPMVGTALLVGWWLFASRLRWPDRLLIPLACAAIGTAASACYHSSFGFFGIILYTLPTVTTAWLAWLLLTPFLRWPIRRAGLLVVFVLAWGYFGLLRFEGVDGGMTAQFQYRWNPTAEEQFLSEIAGRKLASSPTVAGAPDGLRAVAGDWPGFRGANRDGRRPGVQIATDWGQHPPQQLWRHRVGPGWSSFAVIGTRLYTQEQRGEDEVVVCYDTDSGDELWVHRDHARFSEDVAGPGPRATPTFHENKIYALGAAGLLNCLDAVTGRVIWSRDIVADSGAKKPQWGFSSSPLVSEGVVTVFAGAPDGKSVLGYRATTGEPVWSAGDGQNSYCSPQPAHVAGKDQVLIATDNGLTSFQPTDGKVLWRYDWMLEKNMARVIQPTVLDGGDVLIGTGFKNGTRRVHVGSEKDGWPTEVVWNTLALSPYYNDQVVHQGHVYGFDNEFFTCLSLENGAGKWKARGYGHGQVLLLADQSLLLILSEKGEVALVEANPAGHKQLARFQAISGKTWNHPVVAHGKLFVRNGEEAACYQLSEKRTDKDSDQSAR
jgi:outer membrane protein assembly factor BamB